MYSLDTNFLKDREIEQLSTAKVSKPKKKITLGEMFPLFGGVAAGAVPLIAVVGLLIFANLQKQAVNQELGTLKQELTELEAKNQKIKQIKAEIDQAETEAQTFASVFNQVKPWSAILQDLRDRIPAGVQIVSLKQTETLPSANRNVPEGEPAPQLPEIQLTIEGVARNYTAVNDFLLTLQKSQFLQKDKTSIDTAQLVQNPFKLELPKTENAPEIEVELPKVVRYKIITQFNDKPTSELIRELDRKGAVGLVTRIRTLESKGVIKP